MEANIKQNIIVTLLYNGTTEEVKFTYANAFINGDNNYSYLTVETALTRQTFNMRDVVTWKEDALVR